MKRKKQCISKTENKVPKTMNTRLLQPPEKSKSDKKEYRLICLENGLKSLLIHHKFEENLHVDDKSESSIIINDESNDSSDDENYEREKLAALALSIGTGSFKDPSDIQGLAHFVEHMIFMGSEKYPKENELDQYLNAMGGSSNALTECEHTLFYFDVVEEHLEEVIDRFSSLFISPLMLRDSISREIEAVESEFQNNINDDDNRLMMLFASKANAPASTFTWGNIKTLKEEIECDKLYSAAHEFRSKYYVANNMYLSIESSECLDVLQKLVEKYFSDIKYGPLLPQEAINYSGIFKSEFYDKMLFVKPKGDKCKLFMTFIMPSMQNYYKSKPHDYLAYIIQHEGFGSLSSHLKQNLLALHVSAGVEDQSFEGNSLFSMFSIEILLTENGYENIETVIQSIFSVLMLLQSTPIEEHERAYLELKQIRDTSFNFQEEKTSGENTEEYSVNMIYYDTLDIITGPEKFFEFDGEMVKNLINILNEGKFNLTVLTDKYHQYRFTEKWFGTEYDEIEFPDKIKTLWSNRKLSPENFFMPTPNDFICKNFEIVYNRIENLLQHQAILPEKVYSKDNIEVWYKPDNKFLLPHGFVNCYLQSPITFKSARYCVLTSMYSMIAKYYLTEKLYPAICAGLGYSINAAEKGLLIKLSGYNEKLLLLLEIITKELKELALKIEPRVFETFREQCRKNGYNNLILSKFISKDLRLTILESQHKLCLDQYVMTQDVTFEELVKFANDFPDELFVKMMVLGNFEKTKVDEVVHVIKKNMSCSKIIDKEHLISKARKIPQGGQYILYIQSFLPGDKNSTIENYYQIGESTIQRQCLIEFIEQLMQEPLFDILRTKEQLGYSISCSHRVNNGIIGFTITLQVQEVKNPTIKINQRIIEFLNRDFRNILKKLTTEEFSVHQNSLIKLKMMEEVEMENENNRLWSEITSDEYIFNRLDLEAEILEKLTLEEVKDFYDNVMLKAPNISIQVIGEINETEKTRRNNNIPSLKLLQIETENAKVISNVNEFKDSLELYDKWKTQIDN